VIVVFATGAYNASMASNYNRTVPPRPPTPASPGPAAVLVQGGVAELVGRKAADDTRCGHDLLPERFSPVPLRHGHDKNRCLWAGWGFCGIRLFSTFCFAFSHGGVGLPGEGCAEPRTHLAARRGCLFLVALVWWSRFCQPAPHHPLLEGGGGGGGVGGGGGGGGGGRGARACSLALAILWQGNYGA